MLKYSPEHMHCLANIYGALAPPNTGVLAVQSTAANQKVTPHPPSIASDSLLGIRNHRKVYLETFTLCTDLTPSWWLSIAVAQGLQQ